MPTTCRIELLGGLRVLQSEREITRFTTQKTAALLAFLAYFPQQKHPREVLTSMLWPESTPKAGRTSLSNALSSLRRQLEPPGVSAGTLIQATYADVQLNEAAITTDVADFEQALRTAARAQNNTERVQYLTDAVELYRGELLPGFYEEWVLVEQRRLASLYFQAVLRLTTHLEQSQEWERAIDHARRAVRLDPHREEAHQLLLRLFMTAGQPGAALQHYRDLEHLFREQLGIEPSATTRQLARLLENRPHALPSPAPTSAPSSGSERPFQTEYPAMSPTSPPESAQADYPSHLPLSLTRFFGREREILTLITLLSQGDNRLLTLSGTGGTGKTRLAIEVADRLREHFAGAVWFVPLADLSDAALIGGAILDAMRLPRSSSLDPLDQAQEVLAKQPALLVLDNFEQLVDEGALVVQTLVERVPTLTCLVTSRQLLGLTGEREFALGPLPTPAGVEPPESLTLYESVRLFIDRAQAVRPDFQVTNRNAPAVAQLCERLEGIPLALELAAARAQVLSPDQILAQLEHRFDFLVSRKRDLPERHRTLRTAVEWSYRLLSPSLQRFFTHLSVFRGGWTMEAAQTVCEEPLGLEYLEYLRGCSLVLAEETDLGMRFRMLETLREYAEERVSPDERNDLQGHHAAFFRQLAEEAEPHLTGPDLSVWLSRLEREHDNLRAALDYYLHDPGSGTSSLQMANALYRFWWGRGHYADGRKRLIDALNFPTVQSPTILRAEAAGNAGVLAWGQSDFAAAKTFLEESLAISRQLGYKKGIASAHNNLANVASDQGDYAEARTHYEAALILYRELQEEKRVAAMLNNLGGLLLEQGDYLAACPLFQESAEWMRRSGDNTLLAHPLMNLGLAAMELGNHKMAYDYYEESLCLMRELQDEVGIASVLNLQTELSFKKGDLASASRYGAESLRLFRRLGNRMREASCLKMLGNIALTQNEPIAREFYQQSLDIRREIGDKSGIANSLTGLGDVALTQGDLVGARRFYQESLYIEQEIEEHRNRAAILEAFAMLIQAEGEAENATKLFSAADALREASGRVLSPIAQPGIAGCLSNLRADIGEEVFATAWEAGRAMTWEQAVAYALGENT